jgi:hypothetical protein
MKTAELLELQSVSLDELQLGQRLFHGLPLDVVAGTPVKIGEARANGCFRDFDALEEGDRVAFRKRLFVLAEPRLEARTG